MYQIKMPLPRIAVGKSSIRAALLSLMLPLSISLANDVNAATTIIYSVDDLQRIEGNLSGNYVLASDIDASATVSWNAGAGFMPISNFTGTFNGQGHVISGLTINRPLAKVGLFSSIWNRLGMGRVENVSLAKVNITGADGGALVGDNGGLVSNSHLISGTVKGTNQIGGLVGMNWRVIAGSSSAGTVTQIGARAGLGAIGGLVGINNGGASVTSSGSTASVTGKDGVGGLIGLNYGGIVLQSFSTGNVRGANYVGGLVGIAIPNSGPSAGTFADVYATGSVTATGNYVGGLVGYNAYGPFGPDPRSASIDNAYAAGAVTGTGANVGGLEGLDTNKLTTNAYWDSQSTGQSSSAAGTPLTYSQLTAARLPVGFSAQTWKASAGAYPTLKWQSNASANGVSASALAREVVGGDYTLGAKGWDWKASRYVVPDEIKTSGYFWNWVKDSTVDNVLDCSGLVMWAHNKAAGATSYKDGFPVLYEGADGQYRNNTVPIVGPLQPGDLLFFGTTMRIRHVAMYVGCCGPNGSDDIIEAYDYNKGIIWSNSSVRSASSDFIASGRVTKPKVGIRFTAHSPIDLIVTDPEGFTITADTVIVTDNERLHEVSGILYYAQSNTGGRTNLDATVYAPTLKSGNYRVRATPKAGSTALDTYSLDVEIEGSVITLASNASVASIPLEGYAVSSDGSQIFDFRPSAADLNTDGLVNCTDISIAKKSVGKKKGQYGFDVRADINLDGVIDIRDIAYVSQRLPRGTRCP